MTESFYVNASGPAKFSVFGRMYKAQGGDVYGPFPMSAMEQINLSRDRHLLHIVKSTAPAEATAPAGGKTDEYYEPMPTSAPAPAQPDPIVEVASEKIDFFPDVPKPEEEPAESTVGELVPEPEAEPLTSASIEPMVGSYTGEEAEEPKPKTRRTRKAKTEE